MSIVVNMTRLPATQWQTESGSVVSISDARKRYAKSLSVALEPIQDLHGYANPWVGGAGKNLAPFEDVLPDGFTKTERGITVTVHNGIVHLEGVSESQTTWNILDYQTVWNINGISNYPISAGTYSIANGLTCRISSVNKSGTFSVTETSYIRGFYIFVSGNKYQQQVNQDIALAIVAGSTIPTEWTPYENICPISGHSSVTAVRTGKNLLAIPLLAIVDSATVTKETSVFLKAGVYTVSFQSINAESWRWFVRCFNADGSVAYSGSEIVGISTRPNMNGYLDGGNNTRKATTFTLTKDLYVGFAIMFGDISASTVVEGSQLELGSTATAYEPYVGNTYEIDLDGTRYGGSLDVTTGVLTVTDQIFDMASVNWGRDPSRPGVFYCGISSKESGFSPILACSCYKLNNVAVTTDEDLYISGANSYGKGAFVRDTSKSAMTGTEFKNSLSGQTLVYKLATPITIQLTPTEIKMLLGENTVWSDSGSVTVEYARIRT